MIEKLVTSRMRAKLLKLFLTHMDNRYYLRELERMLGETLSPLRRQLLKLVKMGILVREQDGNMKYYRLNKNFEGIEDLRRLALGRDVIARAKPEAISEIASSPSAPRNDTVIKNKHIGHDIAVLALASIFVLMTTAFIAYTNNKSIKQVATLVSESKIKQEASRVSKSTRPDEMISRRWKLLPGTVPALSSEVTSGEKESEEL